MAFAQCAHRSHFSATRPGDSRPGMTLTQPQSVLPLRRYPRNSTEKGRRNSGCVLGGRLGGENDGEHAPGKRCSIWRDSSPEPGRLSIPNPIRIWHQARIHLALRERRFAPNEMLEPAELLAEDENDEAGNWPRGGTGASPKNWSARRRCPHLLADPTLRPPLRRSSVVLSERLPVSKARPAGPAPQDSAEHRPAPLPDKATEVRRRPTPHATNPCSLRDCRRSSLL